jgi:hypothetical protein
LPFGRDFGKNFFIRPKNADDDNDTDDDADTDDDDDDVAVADADGDDVFFKFILFILIK